MEEGKLRDLSLGRFGGETRCGPDWFNHFGRPGAFFPFLLAKEREEGGLQLEYAGSREALASLQPNRLSSWFSLCVRASVRACVLNCCCAQCLTEPFFLARPCSSSFQIGRSVLVLSSPIWATRTWRMIVSTTGRGCRGADGRAVQAEGRFGPGRRWWGGWFEQRVRRTYVVVRSVVVETRMHTTCGLKLNYQSRLDFVYPKISRRFGLFLCFQPRREYCGGALTTVRSRYATEGL